MQSRIEVRNRRIARHGEMEFAAPHRRARDVLARIHAGWKLTNDIQREKKALRAPGRALRTGGESHRQFGEYLGSVSIEKNLKRKTIEKSTISAK